MTMTPPAAAMLDLDAEGLPDEPLHRDPWTFDPLTPAQVAVWTILGVGSLATAGWVLWRTMELDG